MQNITRLWSQGDTPPLTLIGEPWSVYCWFHGENNYYKGVRVYIDQVQPPRRTVVAEINKTKVTPKQTAGIDLNRNARRQLLSISKNNVSLWPKGTLNLVSSQDLTNVDMFVFLRKLALGKTMSFLLCKGQVWHTEWGLSSPNICTETSLS